tara:strand:+ start:2731 stop:2964 length:234 start_codon:yes stop_codon:yes gene_type:complete
MQNKADDCRYCDDTPVFHAGFERRPAYPQYDGYGIYCGRMCDVCFKRKFRSDIMERYETDEPIWEEEEIGAPKYWNE